MATTGSPRAVLGALVLMALPGMRPGQAGAGEPASLFAGGVSEEFGYAVGVKSDVGVNTPGVVVKTLDGSFRPFTSLKISMSHPSATVYSLQATASMRGSRACLAALEPLRDRLQAGLGLELKHESLKGYQTYVGYYGSRDGVVRRISCSNDTLSVSVELQGYDLGCDRMEVTPPPPEAMANARTAISSRFPDAQAWTGPQVQLTLRGIAERTEIAYARRLAELPCLQARLVFYAVVDPAGKVQALETAATDAMDDLLREQVLGIIRSASFLASNEPSMRLVTAGLGFKRP